MDCKTVDARELITSEMRGILGKEFRRMVSHPVSASDIRRWLLAVYFPEQPPQELGSPDADGRLTAPREFNPLAFVVAQGQRVKRSPPAPGGTEIEAGITPPDLKYIVNGGLVCEYGADIREGDVITSSYCVSRYEQKQGRRGSLLFTDTCDTWTNQDGVLVRTQTMTLVRY